MVYCNFKGLHIQQNFVVELFEFYWRIHFITGLHFNGNLLFCIAPLIYWICKLFWYVQKWPTIPIYMSKFYIIKCCQAFLGVISSFRSHCLYAYSYFCGLKHSEPGCFLSQLTKINFWVPVQRYESPILSMLMLLDY